MGKFFYLKLAFSNIRKNKTSFLPYIIANIGIMFTFFLFMLLASNPTMKDIYGGDTLIIIFNLGKSVTGIFAVIFLVYVNSFLMKKRKKEIGLYGILGLEKRHVAYVMFYETMMVTTFSMIIAFIVGIIFGKLLFLILLKLISVKSSYKFVISANAIIVTIVLFYSVAMIMLIYNFIKIRIANPVELLHSDEEGEKEPKSKWIIAIIGTIALGSGYYIARNTEGIIKSMNNFFIAVILVIIGTYLVFTTGSIVLLKAIKKKKNFFYKSKNFIAVSGMIYRMKQNAAGLSSICIISTMILVIASTTICLLVGQENMLKERNYYDINISYIDDLVNHKELDKLIDKTANKYDIEVVNKNAAVIDSAMLMFKENKFVNLNKNDMNEWVDNEDSLFEMKCMTLEEYNRLSKENKQLNSDEIYMYMPKVKYNSSSIVIGGSKFNIKEKLNKFYYTKNKEINKELEKVVYIIMKDEVAISKFSKSFQSNKGSFKLKREYELDMDIVGEIKNRLDFAEELHTKAKELGTLKIFSSVDVDRDQGKVIYGGLFFLGTFLELLFLLAMVLMVYFKQVSEGMEDRNRFIILQNVGMDKTDVKKTINRQILMVFFLPLIGALVHVTFAFKMIVNILGMFALTDVKLFISCTIATGLIFSIIYTIVYLFTSRVYYKIVEK